MKIVVFTGAGISAESGIPTYRDKGGIWDQYDPEEVATVQGWKKNRAKVLEFYNLYRQLMVEVKPNAGHQALVDLERKHEVIIITQNVDNLHERAGSRRVIHLHGNLFENRSCLDPKLIYPSTEPIRLGDKCERGSQLRPNVVWFGEDVPLLADAAEEILEADLFIIVGTSLQVYPANTLVDYAQCKKYLIDPYPELAGLDLITVIPVSASTGLPRLVEQL